MSKSRRREQAKKRAKEKLKQMAIDDMTEKEKSIYRLGFADGRKATGNKANERIEREVGNLKSVAGEMADMRVENNRMMGLILKQGEALKISTDAGDKLLDTLFKQQVVIFTMIESLCAQGIVKSKSLTDIILVWPGSDSIVPQSIWDVIKDKNDIKWVALVPESLNGDVPWLLSMSFGLRTRFYDFPGGGKVVVGSTSTTEADQ